jgi:hypothetical protein
MKTQRLTITNLQTMKKQCPDHPEVELRVIVFCPACRGGAGGKQAAKTMTAAEKSERGRNAVLARWKKAKAAKKASGPK